MARGRLLAVLADGEPVSDWAVLALPLSEAASGELEGVQAGAPLLAPG